MKAAALTALALVLAPQPPPAPVVPPRPAAPVQPAPEAPKPPPPRPVLPPPTDAAPACRTLCDRTYYQCLAGEDADQCPSSWMLCRSACAKAKT